MPNTTYDVIVIGAGPAGENAADLAGRGGLEVAIVERELVGGECSYYACMPSKALLRPGEAVRAAHRAPGAAEAVSGEIDVEAALRRRDALAANWNDRGQVSWLEKAGVDLIRGHGRLAGPKRVEVEGPDGERTLYEVSTAVVIATGSGAAMPPIPGLESVGAWDNRHVTTAKEVPRRLLVLGGGVVGVEMAQAWKTLGSEEVTVVEMMPALLPREEPFAGQELRQALERIGVAVFTGTTLTRVERLGPGGPVIATLSSEGGGDFTVEADEILVAVGRRALTTDLGLDTVGLEPGRWIDVDDRMLATGVDGEWLYVVGDANGRSLLTHTGKYQARIAGARIAGIDTTAWSDVTAVPRVVFTDPHIAAVGLTEAEAREQGIEVRTVSYNIGHVAGSSALGRGIRGTCHLVIDAERRVIVGATFVGPGAGELLHAATIAIVGEVTLDRLWHATPAFPTMSEVWLRFLEAYRDQHHHVFV